ncbi:hypothetical protein [Staphylospora marina]|uniref:hypothetical protein n=1 Tax=Staphylospora marina TaxID=2490858 RepID=UPI000F5C135A|nr:hypothetical protein [Staphylospora marina]
MPKSEDAREFVIKGWLYEPVTLIWREGTLSSDNPEILASVKEKIRKLEEIGAFFLCPETRLCYTENYLADPFSAYLVLKHVLEVVHEAPDKAEVLAMSRLPAAKSLPCP